MAGIFDLTEGCGRVTVISGICVTMVGASVLVRSVLMLLDWKALSGELIKPLKENVLNLFLEIASPTFPFDIL